MRVRVTDLLLGARDRAQPYAAARARDSTHLQTVERPGAPDAGQVGRGGWRQDERRGTLRTVGTSRMTQEFRASSDEPVDFRCIMDRERTLPEVGL